MLVDRVRKPLFIRHVFYEDDITLVSVYINRIDMILDRLLLP